MNRWSLSISTTAAVVLFTIGAYAMFDSGNYIMAGLFLFFSFCTPLQAEAIRDRLLSPTTVRGELGSRDNDSSAD